MNMKVKNDMFLYLLCAGLHQVWREHVSGKKTKNIIVIRGTLFSCEKLGLGLGLDTF